MGSLLINNSPQGFAIGFDNFLPDAGNCAERAVSVTALSLKTDRHSDCLSYAYPTLYHKLCIHGQFLTPCRSEKPALQGVKRRRTNRLWTFHNLSPRSQGYSTLECRSVQRSSPSPGRGSRGRIRQEIGSSESCTEDPANGSLGSGDAGTLAYTDYPRAS